MKVRLGSLIGLFIVLAALSVFDVRSHVKTMSFRGRPISRAGSRSFVRSHSAPLVGRRFGHPTMPSFDPSSYVLVDVVPSPQPSRWSPQRARPTDYLTLNPFDLRKLEQLPVGELYTRTGVTPLQVTARRVTLEGGDPLGDIKAWQAQVMGLLPTKTEVEMQEIGAAPAVQLGWYLPGRGIARKALREAAGGAMGWIWGGQREQADPQAIAELHVRELGAPSIGGAAKRVAGRIFRPTGQEAVLMETVQVPTGRPSFLVEPQYRTPEQRFDVEFRQPWWKPQ